MSRRAVTLLVSMLTVMVLVVVGALVSVPYVALSPGPTINTLGSTSNGQPLIVVQGRRTYPTSGHLNLVTVSVSGGPGRQLGLFNAILGWWQRNTAVVPEEELFQKGTTPQQSVRQSQLEMEQSQQAATSAALLELGIKPKAIDIHDFVTKAPAAAQLRKGDILRSIDGRRVTGLAQLTELVGTHRKPGDLITLGIRRAGHDRTVRVPTMAAPGQPSRAIIGIYPEPVWPFRIDFHLEDVGGPSAGMMFALGIIDKLTPGDLTGDRFIAGTGEIGADGEVGAIGGIAQKMAGARRDHASYFLAPASNCQDVRQAHVPSGLQVVKVSTLHQALGDVRAIAAGRAAGLPGC
ncbi:MAG: PDZ domain-containing protein [Frankiaceae bacterium]